MSADAFAHLAKLQDALLAGKIDEATYDRLKADVQGLNGNDYQLTPTVSAERKASTADATDQYVISKPAAPPKPKLPPLPKLPVPEESTNKKSTFVPVKTIDMHHTDWDAVAVWRAGVRIVRDMTPSLRRGRVLSLATSAGSMWGMLEGCRAFLARQDVVAGIGIGAMYTLAGTILAIASVVLLKGLHVAKVGFDEASEQRWWDVGRWLAWGIIGIIAYRVGARCGIVVYELLQRPQAVTEGQVKFLVGVLVAIGSWQTLHLMTKAMAEDDDANA